MSDKQYYVYILTIASNVVLYTGVTNNLIRRVYEHKNKLVKGFSEKYNLYKLIYFEIYSDIETALNREKQIKAGSRQKKLDLVVTDNPEFRDLYPEII